MHEHRTKLSDNGRVLIPADIRKAMHIAPGDELIVKFENGEIHLTSLASAVKKAQLTVKQYIGKTSLTEQLQALRKEERNNES